MPLAAFARLSSDL